MELRIERDEWTPPNQNIQSLFESNAKYVSEKAASTIGLEATVEDELVSTKELEKLPSTLVKLIKYMDNIRSGLETHKKEILRMNNEVKHAQSLLVRYAKKHVKQQEKETSGEEKGRARGFARPTKVSAELCAFLGVPPGTLVSRTDTIVYLNKYIKEHELQDPHNLQNVVLDDKLARLFGGEAALISTLTFFKMQKYLSQHFSKNVVEPQQTASEPSTLGTQNMKASEPNTKETTLELVKTRGKRATKP
jgi:chromatin remodeling complex protein RSC6